jgi:hypothetical protein
MEGRAGTVSAAVTSLFGENLIGTIMGRFVDD